MSNCERLKNDFEKFLVFRCEDKPTDPDDLISSTVNLLHHCVSARCAILQFYGQLMDELCFLHVQEHRLQSISPNHLVFRLLHYKDLAVTAKSKRTSESASSADASTVNHDTPLSPPLQSDDVGTGSNGDSNLPKESDFDQLVHKLISTIKDTLQELMQEPDGRGTHKLVIDWSMELLSTLPSKYNPSGLFRGLSANACLAEQIRLWKRCPGLEMLLDLVVQSIQDDSAQNTSSILNCVLRNSPTSNWVCAYLLTALPESNTHLLSACIDAFLQQPNRSITTSASGTAIFSFVSEKNPKAIVLSLKKNISVLLKLAFTSKPLLDLLAVEIVNEANINLLNSLENSINEDLKEFALYCIFNAPNSFDLIRLLIETCVNPQASDKVKQQSQLLAQLVVKQLHGTVYCVPLNEKLDIANILKQNLQDLVSLFVRTKSQSRNLAEIELRILHLLCVHFGRTFCTEVLHELLDQLNTNYDRSIELDLEGHHLIKDFLQSLRFEFGNDVYDCIREAMQTDKAKKPRFWGNILSLFETDSNCTLELSLVVDRFTALVQENQNYYSLFHLLRIIYKCLQSDCNKKTPQHHLCIALVANYTKTLNDVDLSEEMEVKLNIISLSHDCIQLLSTAHSSNQHIICRALIESELDFSQHNKSFVKIDEFDETSVNLLKENLDYGTTFNFRKVPLAASLRDSVRGKKMKTEQMSANKQFIFDAIRHCVGDNLPLLADLLVEIVTPDVMFNDKCWPDEDFLKVTIERDLHITSKFESHPLLWNLCEMIAKGGALRHCSVLIRALIAVQITQWNSATASKNRNKLDITKRLICLIAQSELVPDIPFKDLHLALPYLDSYEIYCILDDIWKFLKDCCNINGDVVSNADLKFPPLKPYFERLRLIGSEKFPNNLYIRFFRPIY